MHRYALCIQPVLARMVGEIRRKRNYSQERMAECLRIATRSYSNLELGKSKFSGPSLLFFILMLTEEELLAMLRELCEAVRAYDESRGYAA